jgi:hypothetical protein
VGKARARRDHDKPSIETGFARNAGESRHPEQWEGLANAWCPSLGNTGAVLFDFGPGNPGGRRHGRPVADAGSVVASDLWDVDPVDGTWVASFGAANAGGSDTVWELYNAAAEPAWSPQAWSRSSGKNGYTVMCWAKVVDYLQSGGPDGRYFSMASGTSENNHIVMLGNADNDQLRCRIKDTSTTSDTVLATQRDAVLEDWHFIAVVHRYDPGGTAFELFCGYDGADGLFLREGADGDGNLIPDASAVSAAGADLYLGSNPGSTGTIHDGWLDDVRIYNRALTEDELRHIYELGRGSLFQVADDVALVVPAVGSKTATGSPTFLQITAAGVGSLTYLGTGSGTFPQITAAGVGNLTYLGTGAGTFPQITAAGTGEVGDKTATGAGTFPQITAAGVGEAGEKTATGSGTFPQITAAGVGEVGEKTATGAGTFPQVTSAGVGKLTYLGAGAGTFPQITSAGVGVVGDKTATGAGTFPQITSAGVGSLTYLGAGAATLPQVTAAGVGKLTYLGTGAGTFPQITSAGVGTIPVVGPIVEGTGSATLLRITSAGVGEVGRKTATGASTFPQVTTAGIGWSLTACDERLEAINVSLQGNELRHYALPVASTSADITLDETYRVVLVDASSAVRTITLPIGSDAPGRTYDIKKTDSSTNKVTIDIDGAGTIDGDATRDLVTQYANLSLISDGTNWHIL